LGDNTSPTLIVSPPYTATEREDNIYRGPAGKASNKRFTNIRRPLKLISEPEICRRSQRAQLNCVDWKNIVTTYYFYKGSSFTGE
jgi:hypothetical protein